jgi:chemotaxis protein methyltransferase CheR
MTSGEISPRAFQLLRDYVERECGISLDASKRYLVESRLRDLLQEESCSSYDDLYTAAQADRTGHLRDRIVDALTTNETLWFRDSSPFKVFRELLLPSYAEEIKAGRRKKIRIWSAAASTGQEAYSIAIEFHEYLRQQTVVKTQHLSILGTDISPSAIAAAKAARYNGIAVDRGLNDELRQRYFRRDGRHWMLSPKIRDCVQFKRFNLQESFAALGRFDIVLLRYVAIYFSDSFKSQLYDKVKGALAPGGILFLGASETLGRHGVGFEVRDHGRGLYYQVRGKAGEGPVSSKGTTTAAVGEQAGPPGAAVAAGGIGGRESGTAAPVRERKSLLDSPEFKRLMALSRQK